MQGAGCRVLGVRCYDRVRKTLEMWSTRGAEVFFTIFTIFTTFTLDLTLNALIGYAWRGLDPECPHRLRLESRWWHCHVK